MTDHPDPLPPFGGPLRLEGPAADRPFIVAGTRAALAGSETRGVGAIRLHPFAALRDLRVAGATPERIVVTAVGVERDLDVRGRRVLERASAAPEAALVALEWAVPDESGESAPCFEPVDLEIVWSVDLEPAAGPLEIRRGPRGATLHRGDAAVTVAIDTPAAARWTLEVTDPAGLRVLARVPPGAFLRLTLTGDEAAARPPADSAAAAATHVAARLGAARRHAAAGLGVVVPDPVLRDALAWAAHRLDELLVQRPGAGSCIVEGYSASAEPRPARAGALWTALAALAAGDSRLSAGALRYLRTLLPDPDAAAAVLLLAARHLAWMGDAAPLREAWPDVTWAGRICRDAEERSPLAAPALAEAAIAAESLRLPLHEPGETPGAAATPTRRPEHSHALAEAGGWGAFADGRTRTAFDAWSGLAAAGIDPGRGLWTGAAGLDDAVATARVLNGFVYGLLGAEPDARRHRLRLRPQLPEAWDSADVLRIRMGEASLSLRFRREGALQRFEVEPEAGPVPVRVILEPALPGRLRAAHIDGVAAELDPRPFGERVLAPVQLVVDHPRIVELEVEPPDDGSFVPGAAGPLVRLHRRA